MRPPLNTQECVETQVKMLSENKFCLDSPQRCETTPLFASKIYVATIGEIQIYTLFKEDNKYDCKIG